MKKYLTLFAVLGVFVLAGCTCMKEKTILFDFDSAELTMSDRAELDQVAAKLKKAKTAKVEVYGYTDAVGSSEYNMALSKQRAVAAASYLQAQGIESDRVTVGAFGQNKPIASNSTMEGRQVNRRVEIIYYK